MSKTNFKRILVVTDGLKTSDPTHKTAFNLAQTHRAAVVLVDTLKPPSTTSNWFSSNASDVFEMLLADKQERLEAIATQFRNRGVATEAKVLFGRSSEAITREAVAWEASLVVRYMKGVHSKFTGMFGNTARSLMRICPVPLLLVDKKVISEPRVLACIDTEHDRPENESIIEESARLAKDKENLLGLYCWELYGRDSVQRRMNAASFKNTLEYAESLHRDSFNRFTETNEVSMFGEIRMENGDPSDVIPTFCQHEDIDVVVMCSASLNHPLTRYFGSTVETVIDKLPCNLLVVKPKGFVSPIATTMAATIAQ